MIGVRCADAATQADLNDKESLVRAMTGAFAVFTMTNYWEKMDMQLEIDQGKALADAAKETGVKLYIWSSLLNIKKRTSSVPLETTQSFTFHTHTHTHTQRMLTVIKHAVSNGKLPHVYHFDAKALVEDYVRSLDLPATFFMPGFFMTNTSEGGMLRRLEYLNNNFALALPTPDSAPVPLFDTEDTGKWIKAIVLRDPKEVVGKQIYAATSYTTPKEMIAAFQEAFPEDGKEASFVSVPHEQYLQILQGVGMPEFAAVELLENMRLLDEFGYYGGAGLEESQALLDKEDRLTTWDEFIRKAPAFAGLK